MVLNVHRNHTAWGRVIDILLHYIILARLPHAAVCLYLFPFLADPRAGRLQRGRKGNTLRLPETPLPLDVGPSAVRAADPSSQLKCLRPVPRRWARPPHVPPDWLWAVSAQPATRHQAAPALRPWPWLCYEWRHAVRHLDQQRGQERHVVSHDQSPFSECRRLRRGCRLRDVSHNSDWSRHVSTSSLQTPERSRVLYLRCDVGRVFRRGGSRLTNSLESVWRRRCRRRLSSRQRFCCCWQRWRRFPGRQRSRVSYVVWFFRRGDGGFVLAWWCHLQLLRRSGYETTALLVLFYLCMLMQGCLIDWTAV